MLPVKYRLAVLSMPVRAQLYLRDTFQLDRTLSLYSALRARGLSQADVVFSLLRHNAPWAVKAVETLIGRPITILPPAVPPRTPKPATIPPRVGDRRIIVKVERNPRLPTTDSFQRYRELRPGRTLEQCLRRGVTRKDLREAMRSGWVEVRS